MKLDQDIEFMLRGELKKEILKIRSAIRVHKIECNDDELYFILPEITKCEKNKSVFKRLFKWFRKWKRKQ
jgi:hypothetical protein